MVTQHLGCATPPEYARAESAVIDGQLARVVFDAAPDTVIPTKYGLSALIYRRHTLDVHAGHQDQLDRRWREEASTAPPLVRRGDREMTQAQSTLFDEWVAGGMKHA